MIKDMKKLEGEANIVATEMEEAIL